MSLITMVVENMCSEYFQKRKIIDRRTNLQYKLTNKQFRNNQFEIRHHIMVASYGLEQ